MCPEVWGPVAIVHCAMVNKDFLEAAHSSKSCCFRKQVTGQIPGVPHAPCPGRDSPTKNAHRLSRAHPALACALAHHPCSTVCGLAAAAGRPIWRRGAKPTLGYHGGGESALPDRRSGSI